MKLYENMVKTAGVLLDKIAQVFLCVLIIVVVANVLLRVFLGNPILGTYEYVGFFASLLIGFSLAYCALEDGNIAIEFFYHKLSKGGQIVVDIIMSVTAFIFFVFVTWHMGRFAHSMVLTGEVSAATGTPVFYFVYMVAFGILMLCLVLLLKTLNIIKEVLHK